LLPIIKLVIKRRILKYSWNQLCEIAKSGYESDILCDFIYPLAILRNLSKDDYFDLVSKYEAVIGEIFPYHIIREIEEIYL
jgi:hypothetical protein